MKTLEVVVRPCGVYALLNLFFHTNDVFVFKLILDNLRGVLFIQAVDNPANFGDT